METRIVFSILLLDVLSCGRPQGCFVAREGNETITSVGA